VSVNLYVKKPDAPITRNDLEAAVSRVPHYGLREDDGDLWVEVPCGDLGSAWLEYLPSNGILSLDLPPGMTGQERKILDALRRFAGCVPGAVVSAEGQTYDPLPWDSP
jgi:hypothetical protein